MTGFDFLVIACVLAVLAFWFCVDLSWPRLAEWWRESRRRSEWQRQVRDADTARRLYPRRERQS